MKITKRERVRMAVQHVQPDIVPWSIELTDAALASMAEYYAEPRLADQEFFSTWVGNHFTRVGPTGKGQFHGLEEQVEPGIWRDGLTFSPRSGLDWSLPHLDSGGKTTISTHQPWRDVDSPSPAGDRTIPKSSCWPIWSCLSLTSLWIRKQEKTEICC